MIVTNEYIYNHPKLDEIIIIIENVWLEHDLTYDIKWASQVRIIFKVKFFDEEIRKQKKLYN